MTSTRLERSPTPSPASAEATRALGRGRVAGLVVATALVVAVLGRVSPLDNLRDALTGGGATVRMQPVRMEARTTDVKTGDALLETLSSIPATPAGKTQILVIGNSQQYTSSLPRGAALVPGHEVVMASQQLAERLSRRSAEGFTVYTSAAPNQNFAEALWQSVYWFKLRAPPPQVLLLQASFDTFRKAGVRPGFQTLLDEPRFVEELDRMMSMDPRAYHDEFAAARRDFRERRSEGAAGPRQEVTLEDRLRSGLERLPLFRRREEVRSAFLGAVYLLRVRALGISPTTKRHITGQPLTQNLEALADMVRLARGSGASVLLYNAPINPAVSMFYEDEYERYLEALRAIAAAEGAEFADLSSAVPSEYWGYWVDGPDPIHFDERGHGVLAERLDEVFGPGLARP